MCVYVIYNFLLLMHDQYSIMVPMWREVNKQMSTKKNNRNSRWTESGRRQTVGRSTIPGIHEGLHGLEITISDNATGLPIGDAHQLRAGKYYFTDLESFDSA